MPRNYNKYQYETSPRKIKPDYTPTKKNPYKQKPSTTVHNKNNKKQKVNSKQKKSKVIVYVMLGFAILFAITYRNAKIDEDFSKVQKLKKELALIQKENEQMEVSIESNLNLSNLEKQARDTLGMHKLTNRQTIYVDLPKNDYIQTGTEKVVIEDNSFSLKNIINTLSKLFK